jgi:hypothetical protein
MRASKPNEVTVSVDAAGAVACAPEQLTVSGCDEVLKFHIKTAGYVFPDREAVVVDNPGKQFPFPSRTLPRRPATATLYDHNTEARDFKYTVTVRRLADGELLQLDPTITNEP